jgi:hypothetical protein
MKAEAPERGCAESDNEEKHLVSSLLPVGGELFDDE